MKFKSIVYTLYEYNIYHTAKLLGSAWVCVDPHIDKKIGHRHKTGTRPKQDR